MKLYKTLFLRLLPHHHPPRPISSSLLSHFSSSTWRHEEESRGVKVSVWWDFENCHLPSGGKNSTDRALITDLMCWVAKNPPPAHLFLISSDSDFSSVLHKLRMSNYNILLAGYEEMTPGVLCSAASIMWDWNALLRGNNLTGKCFNQPPDGPYNSWYGHYKTPLLDPFATPTKQEEACTSVVRVEELQELNSNTDTGSSESCTVSEEPVLQESSFDTSPVPVEVVEKIGLVLSLYPRGITITELRKQLMKRKIRLGEDFYGYKRFSRFLLSMPEILKVVPKGEGVFLVHACKQGIDKKFVRVEKMPQVVEDVKKESESLEIGQDSVPVMCAQAKDEDNQIALTVEDDVSSSKKRDGPPEIGLEHLQEKKHEGVVSEVEVVVDDKDLESRVASSTSSESAKEVKADIEVVNESPGLLSRLMKRFNLFCGRTKELSNTTASEARVDDIFAQDSFWNDVESFINSPRGFVVVSHSPSREALAKNLKNEGPSSLKHLDLSKTLDLVSLLVSDKKWIKENPSDTLPFRVTRFTEKKSSCLNNPQASSVLRSMFVNMSKSQCNEADAEKKSKNSGVSEKPLERSRSEVITDCHKLIKKITKENPGGYNMSNFKKDFLEEFKYRLDYQHLGYPKLQSLIQMMPEAKIESGYIVPSSTLAPHESKAEKNEGAALKESGDEKKKKKEEGNKTERDVLKILGCWDSVEDVEKTCVFGKDKLVDGILTSLREKASGETRVQ
ncbi:unnamed protein product [Eruca vesicaria subsp. sativa]|uniref:HTH OST-type domain-containing protein n=1 Tax=Eruca vesicaria subsp. sativa TaxID=29727 RepID=A0ABC8J9L3_ERUVS|nr:unnamed protein product [Eruca vesicaria subsp. sativa]